MAQTRHYLRETLQLIADILSFETSKTDLELRLCSKTVNWDVVVIVASKHLVLPAVYCRMQQRSLLECLPTDLNIYLKELTELNRNRNQTLLEEAKTISNLFIENAISFVFLKGIALLAGDYYKDYGERMIGDIDILVSFNDLDKAFDLLTSEGYSHTVDFNYEVKNYRHRPRQISDNRIGAIELHGQLFKHGFNHLIDKDDILADKNVVNGLPIPKAEHLIKNVIYALQINDKATYYNTLNLKGIFDVLVLKFNHEIEFIQKLSQEKHGLQFLNISSVFFPELSTSQETLYLRMRTWFFLMQFQYPKFRRLLYKVKQIVSKIVERLQLVLSNSSYRQHLLKNKILK